MLQNGQKIIYMYLWYISTSFVLIKWLKLTYGNNWSEDYVKPVQQKYEMEFHEHLNNPSKEWNVHIYAVKLNKGFRVTSLSLKINNEVIMGIVQMYVCTSGLFNCAVFPLLPEATEAKATEATNFRKARWWDFYEILDYHKQFYSSCSFYKDVKHFLLDSGHSKIFKGFGTISMKKCLWAY